MNPSSAGDPLSESVTLRGLSAGQRMFGRFTLVRLLGRGGMGVVWLARDEELEQQIALKFLPELLALDRTAMDDFRHETRRSRELTHPNIVRVHDFVRDEQTAAIAMEFVDGDTVANLRLGQPHRVFEPGELLPWVQQLAAALDYAHSEVRVVHRDLKPSNVMVTAQGRLKVADFGISATVSETVTRVSRVASSSGTLVYMSPQQMMGDRPSPRDDIYSFGATLYELLTGKPPFYAGNILAQVQSKVPPSIVSRREELEIAGTPIPPNWEETIAACLAKDAAARPRTAGEVAVRLGGGAAGLLAASGGASGGREISPLSGAQPAGTRASVSPLDVEGATQVLTPREVASAQSPAGPGGKESAPDQRSPIIGGGVAFRKPQAATRQGGEDEPDSSQVAASTDRPRKPKGALFAGIAALILAVAAWVTWEFGFREQRKVESARVSPAVSSAKPDTGQTQQPKSEPAAVTDTPRRSAPAPGKAAGEPADPPVEVSPVAPAREFVLSVDPPDAAARVWLGPRSDVPVERGRLVISDLPDGEHELIVQAPGYQPLSTRVNVSGGRGEVVARLVAVKGAVQIRARPGTTVSALAPDGRIIALGSTGADGTLRSDNVLNIGAYTFRMEHADCAPVVLSRQELVVGRALALAPPQAPLPGELRVFTVPTGAGLRIGGASKGITPATLRDLPAEQSLTVEVALRGYRTVRQEITLKPKEVRTLNLGTLVAEAGAVGLRMADFGLRKAEGLSVSIDGREVSTGGSGDAAAAVSGGRTLLLDGLEVGTRTVAVSHPDHEPWTQQVAVRDQQTTPVTVTLKPKPATLTVVVQGPAEFTVRAGTDEFAGRSGAALLRLPAGQTVELELVARGYKSARRSFTLPANGADSWNVALEKLRGADAGQPWTVPDLELKMLWIAPGSFAMGTASVGESDERPVTQVRLARGFWLGRTEVTQRQWAALMGGNPSNFKGDDRPVEQVSWEDALQFCQKLTEREQAAGRLPEGYVYTLPTEAQWEYACRAGTSGDYAGNLDAMAWYDKNSGRQTHPVAQKQANAWGLYDMHGNVWEWCADRPGNYPGGSVSDPQGASSGSYRVFRGGSWFGSASSCRSAYRYYYNPDYRNSNVGFRPALSSVP